MGLSKNIYKRYYNIEFRGKKKRPAIKSLILSVAGGIFKMRSNEEQNRFSASFSQKKKQTNKPIKQMFSQEYPQRCSAKCPKAILNSINLLNVSFFFLTFRWKNKDK